MNRRHRSRHFADRELIGRRLRSRQFGQPHRVWSKPQPSPRVGRPLLTSSGPPWCQGLRFDGPRCNNRPYRWILFQCSRYPAQGTTSTRKERFCSVPVRMVCSSHVGVRPWPSEAEATDYDSATRSANSPSGMPFEPGGGWMIDIVATGVPVQLTMSPSTAGSYPPGAGADSLRIATNSRSEN